jgi:hypothetical protein
MTGAAGGHEYDLLAERLSGQVGDVAADDRQAGGVRQVDARPGRGVGVGSPGGPAVDPAVPAFFGDVAGFGGDQIAACGDGRGVQRRPVPLDRQQVIGVAVPGQVAGGVGAGVGCVGQSPAPGDVHLAQQRAHLGGLGGALGNGDLPEHHGGLPLGPAGHRPAGTAVPGAGRPRLIPAPGSWPPRPESPPPQPQHRHERMPDPARIPRIGDVRQHHQQRRDSSMGMRHWRR